MQFLEGVGLGQQSVKFGGSGTHGGRNLVEGNWQTSWSRLTRVRYPQQQCECSPPFHQTDIIGAMVIVWRARGKIVRSVLCSILCNNCTQWTAHTHMNRTNSSLDWVLSHWAHFTVLRFIFVYVLYCVWLYIACMCSTVTWWGGPGGIEAWSLRPLLPSVLWLGHLTRKTRPRYDL